MKFSTKSAIMLLITLICINAFHFMATLQSTPFSTPKIFFYGAEKPQLLAVLRDLPSAINGSSNVSVYLRGGKPAVITFEEFDKLIMLGVDIKINNISLENLSLSSYMLELGGFYAKMSYYTSDSQITVYTMPLYTAKSIYVSVCPSKPNTITVITFALNISTGYAILKASENSLLIEVNGSPVKLLIMPSIRAMRTTNTSIEVGVPTPSGSCMNTIIIFDKSYEIKEDTLVQYIDYTAHVFGKLLVKYPIIQTTNYQISSLYMLSLFNTINMLSSKGLEDSYIGVLPTEMLSHLYISMLINNSLSCNHFISHLSSIDDAYVSASMLYFYLARNECNEHSNIQYVLNILKVLINATTSNNTLELVKAYSALNFLELVASLKGYSDIAFQISMYKNLVEDKLRNLYTGIRYLTKAGETTLSYGNIVEAAAISAYTVPNSESHISSVANFILHADISKIHVERIFASDAVESLAQHGYTDQALKLVSAYFRDVLYNGVPCIDFYRAVIKGFLGINVVVSGVSISPQLPLLLANISLTMGKTCINYVNWGSEVDSMYIDSFLHIQPVISWYSWFKSRAIVVMLRRRPLFEMCVGVVRRGVPLANETVYVFTSNGFSSIGITNSSGVLCTIIPCNDQWVHLVVKNLSISLNLEEFSCKRFYLVVNLAKEQQDISELTVEVENAIKGQKALNASVNQLAFSIQKIQYDVLNMRQNLSNAMTQITTVNVLQSFLNRVVYIVIGIALFSLALSILALWRRK